REVGIEVDVFVTQRILEPNYGRRVHRRRVAGEAADAGVARSGAEELLSALRARGERNGLRSVQEAHEDLELEPIGKHADRKEIDVVAANQIIWQRLTGAVAERVLFASLREQVVRNAHLDVVRLAGKQLNRLVLRFPAEARDGAVVGAAIEGAGDSKG